MAETTIRPALEAQGLAVDLIDAHHEHLMTARILWLMTTSKRTRGGHVVLGSSSRSNPLQRYLSSGNVSVDTGYDYIVLLDDGRWRRALATQRAALIDHLLCCMVQREVVNKRSGEITKSWATVGPDISEFTAVIRRHGVYLPAQQQFATVLREQGNTLRLKFPDLDADGREPEEPKDRGEERETTVDGEGTVQATRRTRSRPPKKTLPEPEEARASKSSPDAILSVQDETGADSQPISDGVDQPPTGAENGHSAQLTGSDWRRGVGIGVGELAEHRAARAARS